jgi:hypothetical protein
MVNLLQRLVTDSYQLVATAMVAIATPLDYLIIQSSEVDSTVSDTILYMTVPTMLLAVGALYTIDNIIGHYQGRPQSRIRELFED